MFNGKPVYIRKMRAGGTFRLVLCNNASSNVLNALQLGEITSLRFIPQQTAIEAARVQGVKVKRSDILCWRAEFAAGVGEFVLIGQLRDVVVVVVERLNAASELWGHVDVPQTLTMIASELYTHQDTPTSSQLQDELSWLSSVQYGLTFWRPVFLYGYSYQASCARPG